MKLTKAQRSTLARALMLEQRFDAGIFPRGGSSHAAFRRLESLGLLRFDGWGIDIDREASGDVLNYRLTEAGRSEASK